MGRFSDAAVVESIRQRAPFNLVDGAWLRNIMNMGPCNRVQANLFAIWADEAGNGRTELNHCTERWGRLDDLGFLPQLGVLPALER